MQDAITEGDDRDLRRTGVADQPAQKPTLLFVGRGPNKKGRHDEQGSRENNPTNLSYKMA